MVRISLVILIVTVNVKHANVEELDPLQQFQTMVKVVIQTTMQTMGHHQQVHLKSIV